MKNNVGTLWWAKFFFKRLDRNFLFSLKCMVCNYFVNFPSAVVSQLSNLRTIMKNIDMGTLWCAKFFPAIRKKWF